MNSKRFSEVLAGIEDVARGVRRLLALEGPPSLKLRIVRLNPVEFISGGNVMFQLHDNEEVVAAISGAVDAEGNPVSLDGPPVWSSSDSGIVTVTPSADGMACIVGSPTPGPLGIATVKVEASSNGVALVASAEVEIIAAGAVALNFSFGTPTVP